MLIYLFIFFSFAMLCWAFFIHLIHSHTIWSRQLQFQRNARKERKEIRRQQQKRYWLTVHKSGISHFINNIKSKHGESMENFKTLLWKEQNQRKGETRRKVVCTYFLKTHRICFNASKQQQQMNQQPGAARKVILNS